MTIKTTCYVLFLALLTVVTGCSKKEDIDPRDQFVGTWTESSISVDGQNQPVVPDVLTISKSSGSTTGITINTGTFAGPNVSSFVATISGNGFTADNTNLATLSTAKCTNNTTGLLYFRNIAGSLSGGQLTITVTIYVASTTGCQSVGIELFTKK